MAGAGGAGNFVMPLAAGGACGSELQGAAIAVVAYSATSIGIISFALILWALRTFTESEPSGRTALLLDDRDSFILASRGREGLRKGQLFGSAQRQRGSCARAGPAASSLGSNLRQRVFQIHCSQSRARHAQAIPLRSSHPLAARRARRRLPDFRLPGRRGREAGQERHPEL